MIYQKFLYDLLNIEDIDYGFCISKKNKLAFEKYHQENMLNTLAFAPINYNDKSKIFDMIKNDNININIVVTLVNASYKKFTKNYLKKDVAIEKYIKYFCDWITIITDKKINMQSVKYIRKRVHTSNNLFWFHLIKYIYNQNLFKETVYLIEYVKKNFIKKGNYLYNDLVLFEMVSLKRGFDYLYATKIRDKVCKLSKRLKNFEYLKIITQLECALLEKKPEKFIHIIEKYESKIFNWNIANILNLYELSVYSSVRNTKNLIKNMLIHKDINSYINNAEYNIFEFLNAISINDKEKICFFKRKIEDEFNFDHYKWYLNKNKISFIF